jgi:hypothetical protein
MIVAIERLGASQGDLVATVGRVDARPGAPNVIPGRVEFTVDMRSPSDAVRHRAQRELLALLRDIAVRRRVELETRIYQEIPATALDARITAAVREAIAACGLDVVELSSGAGHDAMMMAALPVRQRSPALQGRHQPQPGRVDHGGGRHLGVQVLLETVRRVDRRLRRRSRDGTRRPSEITRLVGRTSRRRWRSCELVRVPTAHRPVTTRPTRSVPRSCWRPWATWSSVIVRPPGGRAAGPAPLTNLIVRRRFGAGRRSLNAHGDVCHRARAGPGRPTRA